MDPLQKYFGKKISNKAESRLATFAQYEMRVLKTCLNKDEIKRLRGYLVADPDQNRNIYSMITLDANCERALALIRLSAPFVFAAKGIMNITHSSETWKNSVLLIDYGYDDINESRMRLFFSALELVFMRATASELWGVIAFLVDDTRKLVGFDFREWVYRKPKFI